MDMRRKKLWYVPGLYSLLVLPILLWLFGPEDVQEKNALRLWLADDRHYNYELPRHTSDMVLEKASHYKATTIDFWDKVYDERSAYRHFAKLDMIEREIQRMTTVHDTTTLLKIELGEGITYGEFVSIMNLIIVYDIKRYGLVKSTLYIFPPDIPTDPSTYEELQPIYYEDHDYVKFKGPSWWEKFIDDLEWKFDEQLTIWAWYWKYNYILISGFLLFIVLPFILRIKKFRKIQMQSRYPLQS